MYFPTRGLCQLSRHESEADAIGSVEPGLRCRDHSHQLGKPVLMDGPTLRKRHGLVTVRLGTEKGSDLIKDEQKHAAVAKVLSPPVGR
jgi:hypothetical protein